MSDPLSLAASIAGIVAIALHVTNVVSDFIAVTRSAPKSIKSLGTELEILCTILTEVRTMAEACTPDSPIMQSLVLGQILEGVRVDFDALSEILNNYSPAPSGSVLRRGWKQVRWVFYEPEIADLRRSIEVYKSSLLLTLTFANRPDVTTGHQILAELAVIRKDLADMRALCQHLRDRTDFMTRLVRPSASLQELRENRSLVSLAQLTASVTSQTTASAHSSRSAASSSSYWAASIIDLYCSELEDISESKPGRGLRIHAPTAQTAGRRVGYEGYPFSMELSALPEDGFWGSEDR